MDTITSIDAIARQASAAAAQWVPGSDQPENPYDVHVMPAQHQEWQRRFQIALLRSSQKEAA
jgi:hypothetical protein